MVAKAKERASRWRWTSPSSASPDHPYVTEHPDWFLTRPDGTIQYAENPPKKYQDIYPFDFESEAWQELWDELRDVFAFWIAQGVRIFRVDNPHTKPFRFWEWCIGDLKREGRTSSFWPRRSRGRRSCTGWRRWGSRSRTRTSRGATRNTS